MQVSSLTFLWLTPKNILSRRRRREAEGDKKKFAYSAITAHKLLNLLSGRISVLPFQ
jgi:hypothetical protein